MDERQKYPASAFACFVVHTVNIKKCLQNYKMSEIVLNNGYKEVYLILLLFSTQYVFLSFFVALDQD